MTGLCLEVYLVGQIILHDQTSSAIIAIALFAIFVGLWYAFSLLHQLAFASKAMILSHSAAGLPSAGLTIFDVEGCDQETRQARRNSRFGSGRSTRAIPGDRCHNAALTPGAPCNRLRHRLTFDPRILPSHPISMMPTARATPRARPPRGHRVLPTQFPDARASETRSPSPRSRARGQPPTHI